VKRTKKISKNILEALNQQRDENIVMLSKWKDKDLKELASKYFEAQKDAYDENKFESYKILEEKLFQIYAAQNLKYSYTDEASDWIHW